MSDVTRTSILRSLTARELPLAVEGYMVYCRNYDFKSLPDKKVKPEESFIYSYVDECIVSNGAISST